MGWIVMGIPDKVKRHFRMERVCMMNSVVGCSCRLVGGGVGTDVRMYGIQEEDRSRVEKQSNIWISWRV